MPLIPFAGKNMPANAEEKWFDMATQQQQRQD